MMGIEVTVDPIRHLVSWDAVGVITADDIKRARDCEIADANWKPTFLSLVDLSQVTKLDVSVESLKLLSRAAINRDPSRRAVVAPKDADFGLVRLYEAYSKDEFGKFHVFRDMDEALEWLGLGCEPNSKT